MEHFEREVRLRELETKLQRTEYTFSSQVPVLGPFISAFRRLWNNISARWYVQHYVKQQNAVNETVLEMLKDFYQEQAEQERVNVGLIGQIESILSMQQQQINILRTKMLQAKAGSEKESALAAQIPEFSDPPDESFQWTVSKRDYLNQDMLQLPSQMVASPPKFKQRVCKLCDINDWQTDQFQTLASDILALKQGYVAYHRKMWEFVQTVTALQQNQLWDDRAVGLSVAGGSERLAFYATHHMARFIVTDIYGASPFSDREADANFLLDQQAFAPYPYQSERLKPLYMNALDLKFPDNTFDFVISLSSIEHFGGLDQAIQSLQEMARVVKPGGMVVIATECILNGEQPENLEAFMPDQLVDLSKASQLQLIEEIDWSLSEETLAYIFDFETDDDLGAVPHLNVAYQGAIWTSILLVFTKPAVNMAESKSSPASYALLETDIETFDQQIEQIFRETRPPQVGLQMVNDRAQDISQELERLVEEYAE